MADLTSFLDPTALYQVANSQGFNYWISLGINIVISTITGGVVLIILAYIFSEKFNESISLPNAFLISLIGNIINFFGLLGLLLPYIGIVPFASIILPVIIWILLIKVFFGQMSFVHSILLGVVFMVVTMFVTPYLSSMIISMIPNFG